VGIGSLLGEAEKTVLMGGADGKCPKGVMLGRGESGERRRKDPTTVRVRDKKVQVDANQSKKEVVCLSNGG